MWLLYIIRTEPTNGGEEKGRRTKRHAIVLIPKEDLRAIKSHTATGWSTDRTVLLEQTFQDHPVQLLNHFVLLSITTPPNIWGLQHSALFPSNASQSCFCGRKFPESETSASSQQGFSFVFVCGSCKFFSGRQNKGETKAKRLQTTGCKALSWAKGSSAL